MEWSFFICFMKWNWKPLSFKSCHFEASKDIMTKFKSQALHIRRNKYWNASGSGNPPSLIPVLRNIAILGLKTKFSILFARDFKSTFYILKIDVWNLCFSFGKYTLFYITNVLNLTFGWFEDLATPSQSKKINFILFSWLDI